MSSFAPAIAVVLGHEGDRFTDGTATPIIGRVPTGDPPTRWGITLPLLRRIRPLAAAADVEALTRDEASGIYRQVWWDRYGYGRIACQDVATKVFDTAINVGPDREHHMLQRAIRACGYDLAEDGHLGPATLAAVNECEPRELLLALAHEQALHYVAWIEHDPEHREQDRRGLMLRAYWPYPALAATGGQRVA